MSVYWYNQEKPWISLLFTWLEIAPVVPEWVVGFVAHVIQGDIFRIESFNAFDVLGTFFFYPPPETLYLSLVITFQFPSCGCCRATLEKKHILQTKEMLPWMPWVYILVQHLGAQVVGQVHQWVSWPMWSLWRCQTGQSKRIRNRKTWTCHPKKQCVSQHRSTTLWWGCLPTWDEISVDSGVPLDIHPSPGGKTNFRLLSPRFFPPMFQGALQLPWCRWWAGSGWDFFPAMVDGKVDGNITIAFFWGFQSHGGPPKKSSKSSYE